MLCRNPSRNRNGTFVFFADIGNEYANGNEEYSMRLMAQIDCDQDSKFTLANLINVESLIKYKLSMFFLFICEVTLISKLCYLLRDIIKAAYLCWQNQLTFAIPTSNKARYKYECHNRT